MAFQAFQPSKAFKAFKALLVTSSVTYVPGNYRDAIATVIDRCRAHIAGVVLVDIAKRDVLAHAAKAALAGCGGIATQLAGNLIDDVVAGRGGDFAMGVPVWRVQSMNDADVIERVKRERIDLVVNMRTRCIYKDAILRAPRLGCINVHHGLLPKYRGLMCDLHALAEGRPAGFSIHTMTKRIDDGEVLHTEEVSQSDRDYVAYLGKTGAREGRAVARVLEHVAATGALPPPSTPSFSVPVVTRALDLHTARRLQSLGMRL